MILGIPREIKNEEYRVGMVPAGVAELRRRGHTILVETGAGIGSGYADGEYLDAGAEVVARKRLFEKAGLIVKVKEPLPEEFPLLRPGGTLFTYLHLAPNPELTTVLLRKRISAFGYETLQEDGRLPLLSPMSEIAGRMAPLVGSWFLQKAQGGTGLLPTGVAGVMPGKAVILGAGVVGSNAARVAAGIGMAVVVLNRGIDRLREIDAASGGRIKTLPLTTENIMREFTDADLLIGAVLVPGGKTPVLITRAMLRSMKKGSVIVDVSIDQGGCAETSRPSTHDRPVYTVDGIIHYTVANMPGAFPRTATLALTNATLPYIAELASMGASKAAQHAILKTALNVHRGKITNAPLAESLRLTKKKG